ncbi:MAG: hypothetical protein MUO88_14400 [Desulfobacterales bacterium]|nr:hypothetical protein [Desulfobacterales bacterium]
MKKQSVRKPTAMFIEKLRNFPKPKYQVALQVGIRPQTFYALCAGIIPCRPNDERIIAVGQIIGLEAADCLEPLEGQKVR